MKVLKKWFLKSKFKLSSRTCFGIYIYFEEMLKRVQHDILFVGMILVISVVASWALLKPGFIPTHDGEYHIIRFWQFYKVLSSGIWFPRWAPDLNNGFGVPLFNFVYPLPNYIAAVFHFLGFSFTDTLKMVLLSGFILSGFSFYFLLRFFFKPLPSFLGSIFYLLAPYHLVDVYVRGSVGEVWALAIAPLVLYFGLSKKYFFSALSISLLILSHNILALMFFMFIVLFLVIHLRGVHSATSEVIKTMYYSLLGLTLASFFWLPALWEKQYVVGLEQVSFADHFPQLWQLLFPSWGTGFSGSGDFSNQMSFQIGIPHLIIVVIALFFWSRPDVSSGFPRMIRLVVFLLISLFVVLFLLTPFSLSVWRIVPFLTYFQYPWRFLSLVIFITSFLAAWVATKINKNWVSIFLVLLTLVLYGFYTKPVVYRERQDSYYLTNPTWTLGTDSPGNSFNTIWFGSPKKNSDSLTKTTVYTAYFPGWQVYIDQKPQKTYPNRDGLISFSLPKGKHIVEVKFDDTLIRRWAKYVSILSIILLVINGLTSWKKYENRF